MSRWSWVGVAGFCGIGAGILLLIATEALSRSTLAIGPFSLAGNGAFVVLALGVPFALFGGWTTIERLRGMDLLALGAYALGLAAPLGQGAVVFVVLPAVIGIAVLWAASRTIRPLSGTAPLLACAALGIVAPYFVPGVGSLLATALMTAPALALASRRPDPGWRVGIGIALAGLLLASAFLVPLVARLV